MAKVTALLQISPNKRRFDAKFNRLESKQSSFDFDDLDD